MAERTVPGGSGGGGTGGGPLARGTAATAVASTAYTDGSDDASMLCMTLSEGPPSRPEEPPSELAATEIPLVANPNDAAEASG